MATFFLKCQFRMTYQRLYDDKNVDTSNFMHPRRYKEHWYLIDSYNKSDDYTSRAWEVFEDALNKVLKDTCLPTKGEFKMVVTTDDDKHWYNHSVKLKDVPLHENQSLKRERHVKDNATGITADVCIYSGSCIPSSHSRLLS